MARQRRESRDCEGRRRVKTVPMIGRRFSRLLVKREMPDTSPKRFECLCDCGITTISLGWQLRAGKTVSCGCRRRLAATKHGQSTSREYRIWHDMIRRCTDPARQNWKYYGGRGIKVCRRWRSSFENFFADMGRCPKSKSIDRINNNGNYEPSNCRWATAIEQCANRRTT